MPKIIVRSDNISEPAPGSVAFDNPVLRNLLVQKQPAALEWLASRVAPVDVSKISIDEKGRVVIADKAFADVVSQRLKDTAGSALDNTACSNGSC
jgi:hypothetical protein